ncbi:MAG TPA: extracellular solute-binding protein [Streptosporangiaceae bacterium]|nr:extracellular solute-binding protein [Streptosporangiaceae bacterium]
MALLAACGSSGTTGGAAPASKGSSSASPSASVLAGGASCSSSATKLTFWAWVPGMSRAVTAFNKSHPSICVTLENPGAGLDEYTPLSNALKAGSGAPDVAEIEFDELPSFIVQKDVVNLVPYGASNYKSDFVPWAWQEVSQGSAVYAMPSDAGPAGFYYNSKLLAQYHLTPPTTWAQFATEASTLHKDNAKVYLANFSATDLQWLLTAMAQAGAFPYTYSGGSSVGIHWTGSAELKFASYWQQLISSQVISTVNDANNSPLPNQDLDNGVTASSPLNSAWAPSYFQPDAKKTLGDWRAAALPQWTPGASVSADWGGSTYPVFKQSAHPAAAAQFSEWLTGSPAAWKILKTSPSELFPTYKPLLSDASFKSLTYPVSGTSQPNQVFTAAAGEIQPVQWPPFMTEALNQALTTFQPVLSGKETLQKAFQAFQSQEVSYAKAQGFSVSTG